MFQDQFQVLSKANFKRFQMDKVIMLESQCGKFNRSYLSNFTLLVKNGRINLELYLLRDLVSGVTMDMEFLISMQNSNKYQKIFQYTLDMCNMLAQKRNNIFKKWFSLAGGWMEI